MAPFRDILSEKDSAAIHAFLIADANRMAKEGEGAAVSRFNEIGK